MIDIDSVINLLLLIFIITFIAYILVSVANFFPSFMASLTKKYRLKNQLEFENTKNTFLTPNKKEVKKNHGKRVPFFNKR